MSDYKPPRTRVFQTITEDTTTTDAPRAALIVGPQYTTRSLETMKESLLVGTYDPAVEQGYAYPDKPAGDVVDLASVQLVADNAQLEYWGSGSNLSIPASGDLNRVVSSTTNFVGYSSYALAAAFYGRDVQVGDAIRVTGTDSGGAAVDIMSKITGFEHAVVSATIGSATADAANAPTTSQTDSVTQSAGDVNHVEATVDGTAYDGLVAGQPSETYLITVVTAGDAATARLDVTSLSGTDNQYGITPAAFGSATNIGTRGLTVTFATTGSGTDTPADEFILGQAWTAEVSQAYTVPTRSAAGTYVGTSDTTYIATVTRGGDLTAVDVDDRPLVRVSTTTGVDAKAAVPVATGVAFALGNYGVTLALTGSALVTGDRFLVVVTAAGKGAIRTLVMANSMPTTMAGRTVTVSLRMVKDDLVVPALKPGTAAANCTTTLSGVTPALGMTAEVDDWSNGALPIKTADLYIAYRALNIENSTTVKEFTTASITGTPSPEDPFTYGIWLTLTESGASGVYGISVETDDLAGYTKAVAKLKGIRGPYSVVPLTQDPDIKLLFVAHVSEASSPESGLWRIAWLNSALPTVKGMYAAHDNASPLLATIGDDIDLGGSQFTRVVVVEGAIIAAGVRAGDYLRCNYGVDENGAATYESYKIDRVVSEDTVMLVSGPLAPNSVASKVEFWRVLTSSEAAQAYGAISAAYGDRRIRHVGPDVFTIGSKVVPGYFGACIVAGQASVIYPHQSMTNMAISSITAVPRSLEYFTEDDLNDMAGAGTWLIVQDIEGNVFTRHQLTTAGPENTKSGEHSLTVNLDTISYAVLEKFQAYAGKANLTDALIGTIRDELSSVLDEFTVSTSDLLGPQLLDYTITRIGRHAVYTDRLVCVVNVTLPGVMNGLDIYLVA